MEKMRILITVKSYPLPSNKYGELVCTAGIRDNGEFVRLYPIDFRGLSYEKAYKKYQWIEVEAEKHSVNRDPRKESHRPKVDTLVTVGKPIPASGKGWEHRKSIVLKHPVRSLEELKRLQDQDNTSLGIVKVSQIEDIYYEVDDEDWKPEWRSQLEQMNLFENPRRRLEKIPYKFKFRFRCDDASCKGHDMSITDWEAGVLYLNSLDSAEGTPEVAARKVCERYRRLCDTETRDVYFYVGTVLKWGNWIILGAFYPPKSPLSDNLTLPFD